MHTHQHDTQHAQLDGRRIFGMRVPDLRRSHISAIRNGGEVEEERRQRQIASQKSEEARCLASTRAAYAEHDQIHVVPILQIRGKRPEISGAKIYIRSFVPYNRSAQSKRKLARFGEAQTPFAQVLDKRKFCKHEEQ